MYILNKNLTLGDDISYLSIYLEYVFSDQTFFVKIADEIHRNVVAFQVSRAKRIISRRYDAVVSSESQTPVLRFALYLFISFTSSWRVIFRLFPKIVRPTSYEEANIQQLNVTVLQNVSKDIYWFPTFLDLFVVLFCLLCYNFWDSML